MRLDPNRRQFLKNVTRTAAGVCGVGIIPVSYTHLPPVIVSEKRAVIATANDIAPLFC